MSEITVLEKMVEEFQCPGCVCGGDIKCGSYKQGPYGTACDGHVLGTSIGIGNSFALGLPRGFNKPGFDIDPKGGFKVPNEMSIRLWKKGDAPDWDHLNIPVWAMEKGGHLFVRTYCPRINYGHVDVIQGGTLDMVPNAVDVSAFKGEID